MAKKSFNDFCSGCEPIKQFNFDSSCDSFLITFILQFSNYICICVLFSYFALLLLIIINQSFFHANNIYVLKKSAIDSKLLYEQKFSRIHEFWNNFFVKLIFGTISSIQSGSICVTVRK